MADDRTDRLPLARRIQAAQQRLPRVRTGEDLDRLGEDALLRKIGAEPGPARLDVRLHGAGVVGHRVPVRRATAILGSVQDLLTAIAQELSGRPTARGVVDRSIQDATELVFSPAISSFSVFHLLRSSGRGPLFSPDLDPSPALVDQAVSGLLDLIEDGGRDVEFSDLPSLARRLRVLGPRTARHLNDLVSHVVFDDIYVELAWRGAMQSRTVDMTLERASLLRDAISSNRQEISTVTVFGRLQTISTVAPADLIAEDGIRYKIVVPGDLRPTLGNFYDQQVVVKLREVTTWSISTGTERKTYDLIEVSHPKDSTGYAAGVDQELPEDSSV